MNSIESFQADISRLRPGRSRPGGLLDLLTVAAVVLDADGRIAFWSPQAEELFGYTAQEALGQYAAHLMVHEEHLDLVIKLFAEVMGTGQSWAGAFPIRNKDGTTRLVEIRNMRLLDHLGDLYALSIAADHTALQQVETELALFERLVSQSPIGLKVMDTDLRYVTVNPALARINGLPAADHIGRNVHEALPFLDTKAIESVMRQVLATGVPVLDRYVVGRTPTEPETEHAWSTSYFRLEDRAGRVLGVAASVVDITERHRAATEAARARRRLTPSSPTPPLASAPPWRWTRPPGSWPRPRCRNSPMWPRSTCSTRSWPCAARPRPRPARNSSAPSPS